MGCDEERECERRDKEKNKMNISDVDMDKLSLESLPFQFCSDWLKEEIRNILLENNKLKKIVSNVESEMNYRAS